MGQPGEEPGPKWPETVACAAGPRLAAELRALRTSTGKSLKELEALVHASDSSISRYLSGRIVPPWGVIQRLSRLAGDDPARLRPLWEHVTDDRHRQGACPPLPTPFGEPAPTPAAGHAAEPVPPPRRFDRRARLVVAALTGATAVVFGGSGVLVGLRLAPGSRPPVVQQFAACRDWPWPGPQDGQTAIAPAKVHGRDHTATVQLITRSIGGHEMVWAQITGARYGDRVWMDWTRDDGKTWTQCGPFTTTGATFASRAHEIGPSWHFRACGDTPQWPANLPRNACTRFW